MDEFSSAACARESYALFAAALNKGREILVRAGIATAPPPVPGFDTVYRKLDSDMRRNLYEELRASAPATPADAMRIWQPLLKKALGNKASASKPGGDEPADTNAPE